MKRYNPNTKYGRRKNRETAQRNIDNYNDDEKFKHGLFNGCFVLIVLGLYCLYLILKGK